MVLDWLVGRLAHLLPPRPHGQGGTPPLALEVRLDAVAAVLLDGLSYRRAGRMVGISKTEVGDSMDLLLAGLAALGYYQPDGTFITTLADLRERLGELARTGEAVLVDGLATRVQRPCGWANQKVWYDTKRHAHTAQGLAVSTVHGDLCGVPAAGRAAATSTSSSRCLGSMRCWTPAAWRACWIGGFGAWPRAASTGTPRSGTGPPRTGSPTGSEPTTAAGPGCARWWSSRSGIWPMPGRCAAGGAGSTGSGISIALPGRWSASAGGCTESPPEAASRTPSMVWWKF